MTGPFLLLQLSDPHIGAEWAPGDPAAGLAAAVDCVRSLRAQPDVVLVSGDLSDNATDVEYKQVRDLLSPLGMVPIYVLPGNHDDRSMLRRHFGLPGVAGDPVCYSVDLGPMRLVVLDTTIPGDDPGVLEADQLDWLDAELAMGRRVPTVVAMHHPPLATGIPICDQTGLRAAHRRALSRVVEPHEQVQAIVGGHMHRAMTSQLVGRPVVTAPSTYVQTRLTLGLDVFELSDEPAGFIVHALVDGQVVSHLQLVP